ncbi:MAG: ATP synthase F1 subunit gamma [Candidatus Saccharimonadales bacterium]
MASTQGLKLRIRSVKSTKQITKAMQLVAASKMRRAQEATKASAPYTQAASEILSSLSSHTASDNHPLYVSRPVKTRLMIVIASDKGLAGAYNSNVLKMYTTELKDDVKNSIKSETITVGRKASQFATRIKGAEIIGVYEGLPDHPDGSSLLPMFAMVQDRFVSGEVDAVDLIFTEFVTSLNQKTKMVRILPAGFTSEPSVGAARDVTYEPSASRVLDEVTSRLVNAQIFQAILDARASEHSMRMLAMKNATDNASDLADDLTLAMNKARQGAITQELAEISGGAEAMK